MSREPWFAALRERADAHEPGEDYRVEIWQSDLTRLLDIAEDRQDWISGRNVANEIARLEQGREERPS